MSGKSSSANPISSVYRKASMKVKTSESFLHSNKKLKRSARQKLMAVLNTTINDLQEKADMLKNEKRWVVMCNSMMQVVAVPPGDEDQCDECLEETADNEDQRGIVLFDTKERMVSCKGCRHDNCFRQIVTELKSVNEYEADYYESDEESGSDCESSSDCE
ncbi:MAG: hypothetical protein JSS82_07795 [Bacteroidetes bacterium]|nr:hypothetical protein [Bacteroidota bacterium]